jgi:hypothetical protein
VPPIESEPLAPAGPSVVLGNFFLVSRELKGDAGVRVSGRTKSSGLLP